MKITLNVKIFLIVLFSILIALITNSTIHFASIKKDYLLNFYTQSEKDILIVQSNISDYEQKVLLLLDKFTKDEHVKATLNLISNYQDKQNYQAIIFDEEKKKLLRILDSQINNLEEFSYGLFDKNKEPVLINRTSNLKKDKGIFTYKNKKLQMISVLDGKIKTIPPLHAISNKRLNKVVVTVEEQSIGIRAIQAIYNNNKELVGYIRIKKIFNEKNINSFIKNTTNNFSFIVNNKVLGEAKDIDKKLVEKNAGDFEFDSHSFMELFMDEKFHYHSHFKKTYDGKKLYFVVTLEKKYLESKFKNLISELILTAIIATMISFLITTYFLKANLLNRLDHLVAGIRKVREKEYIKLDTNGVDEIDEIADELNTLTSELQESFLQIEKLNEFLKRIIDTVPVRIFWKDTQGRYIGANKLFLKDAGLKDQRELIGKTDYELPWSKLEVKQYIEDDKDVMFNNISKLQMEETQRRLNGEVGVTLTSKVPLIDQENNVIGVLGIYEDITEHKKLQNELKDKDLILFESSKMAAMGEMLESIAHQWRQPLSVITTGASGIKINKEYEILTDEMLIETLDSIESAAMHLSHTIDDFRDFYKKDKNKYIFDVKDAVNKSLGLVTSKLKNRDIKIIDQMEDIDFNGFENELIQVFMNIINNAIDALEDISNENRFIIINISKDQDTINISFKDNAGGIDAQIKPHIFEHKYTTKHDKDGTGIGLYMSKLIIEKSEGSIDARSVEFEYENTTYTGAEFIITLPFDTNYN